MALKSHNEFFFLKNGIFYSFSGEDVDKNTNKVNFTR